MLTLRKEVQGDPPHKAGQVRNPSYTSLFIQKIGIKQKGEENVCQNLSCFSSKSCVSDEIQLQTHF